MHPCRLGRGGSGSLATVPVQRTAELVASSRRFVAGARGSGVGYRSPTRVEAPRR